MTTSVGHAVLLALALWANLAGLGWLALAMDVHWTQVRGEAPQSPALVRRLRVLGTSGIIAALLLCLSADHASMAALVWIMALAASALSVGMLLTWRPHWLRPLAWIAGGGSARA